MKVVIQRSLKASVEVEGKLVGQIDRGLVLLVGITHEDTEEDVTFIAEKVANLRIFEDEQGKMNHSVLEVGGSLLSVSQFTLYGDCRKGRRPSFVSAAKPDHAMPLYELFNEKLRDRGLRVETGTFGADMKVQLINDGPVTLILES
ncbi:D-aminoacyl-tRNA deacylase [Ammoniphilus resinae]|uniref:D-aminoacyl-tRNA deacylase n=1 Tax=Ammoniphilus resinae TaxID=861532 RepID=A0ABS4GJM2_9BACL|nr:D-aminoacyl-tRNA deacylase [Ammoniphilus resinae]MBP1930450.1 D-tyrosyl-tRNA(Tyr) deacylase [Ammoniphilus resinae]